MFPQKIRCETPFSCVPINLEAAHATQLFLLDLLLRAFFVVRKLKGALVECVLFIDVHSICGGAQTVAIMSALASILKYFSISLFKCEDDIF